MFSGSFERQLDERGRLALPATYRASLGERCIVFLGEDACLGVRTAETYAAEVAELNSRVKRGEAERDELRRMTYTAVEVAPDKQGRIPIDARLRQHVGIEPQQAVVVAGAFDMLEVWPAAAYEQRFEMLVAGATGAGANGGSAG